MFRKMTWTAEKLYKKLGHIRIDSPLCTYSFKRCKRLIPLINEILALKKKKKAIILAHSYVYSDIIYTVADHVGDSYELAKKAKESTAEIFLFSAVRFMAETAKILNPHKTVIDSNPNGKCSLADSITQQEVLQLKEEYPNHTFVCYINTSAEVKAACDVCVTSSNASTIIQALPNDRIFFLPDRLLGQNIQNELKKKKIEKEILLYDGTCYVHEQFTPYHIHPLKISHPDLCVLAHPECTTEVVQKADIIGSTSQIIHYIKSHSKENRPFLILTECGIASQLQVEHPSLRLVGTPLLCHFMKTNSLELILNALKNPKPEQIVTIAPDIQEGAYRSLEQMFQ
jgi:quinolinate synthase